MTSFRRLFPFALAAALSLGLGACAKRETRVALGYRDQIIHIGNLGEPNDLDPAYPDSQQTGNIIMGLFEGLAQYDAKTCEPVPAVAERWEASADGLTWTFHLRSNAKWSNGDPVTAGDFVYAYQRVLSPGLGAEYASMLFVLKNGEEYNSGKITDASLVGAKASDAHTLVLSLAHPVPYLPTMVCHHSWYPVHPATIEKFGRKDQRGTAWTRPGNLVGNGYFILSEWKPHQYIRLTKNPNYWDREHIRLNEAFFYPIEDMNAEEGAFRTGQLHVTASLPTSKVAVYEKEHPEFIQPDPFLATYVYRFNVTKPPLNDVRVRRALAMSIAASSAPSCAGTSSPRIISLRPTPPASRPRPACRPTSRQRKNFSPRPVIPAARDSRASRSSSTPTKPISRLPRRSSRCGARTSASTFRC